MICSFCFGDQEIVAIYRHKTNASREDVYSCVDCVDKFVKSSEGKDITNVLSRDNVSKEVSDKIHTIELTECEWVR